MSRGSRPKAFHMTVATAAVGALVAGALTTAAVSSVAAVPSVKSESKAKYIVAFTDAPVARYTGGIAGLAPSAAKDGARLDSASSSATKYRSYLLKRQKNALARVGGATVLASYTDVLSGVGVELTAAQAAKLKNQPGVLGVFKNEIRKLDTTRTPAFLGLTGRNGGWAQLGGTAKAGKDVVVGIIDSGIWPESKSFSKMSKTSAKPKGWKGTCQVGESFTQANCNNKLIGARYYLDGFGGTAAINPEDYLSPRDGDGHGSHTASTAAGNYGVTAKVDGVDLGKVSGMAPAARIAMYKVCWNGDEGGCATLDSVAAIDQAVKDGVDVINYSISGSTDTNLDPVAIAFLNAAAAGVFIAASAGNEGPGESTVNHNGPWITTVAAGSHDREGAGKVTLGNGTAYNGVSAPNAGVGPKPLILASAAGLAGQDPDDVRLCFLGALDPALVAGKIVVCDRGVNARTDKSQEVKNRGGVGMVLVNTSPNSINADLHFVPSIHVDEVKGAAIKTYAGTSGATATIAPGKFVTGVEAPFVAAFSSRGPGLIADQDLIKPDIMAPGVDVLAAVAPPTNSGRSYDFYSGTSMASPHIAGIGALMKGAHPKWSPMAIKSALMTTTNLRDNKGVALDGTPFDFGAGQVNPTRALEAGLVYNSKPNDWYAYLCATEIGPDFCTSNGIANRDASDLNYASIAIGALAGKQTVTRRVTQTAKGKTLWVPSVKAPAGVTVDVSPKGVLLAQGQSATFRFTFTRTTAALGEWSFGKVTFSDTWKGHKPKGKKAKRHWHKPNLPNVHSMIAIRPVALAAPGEVSGSGVSGSTSFTGQAGYAGPLSSTVAGLVAATEDTASVSGADGGAFDVDHPAAGPHTALISVTVPASTDLARFSTFAGDYGDGTDLDVFVYKDGELVGASAGGSAEEQVDLAAPDAGAYEVYVDAYSLDVDPTTVRLFSWALGSADAGNLTVTAPATVTVAGSVPVTLAWTGLTAGSRYLGAITWKNGADAVGSTLVRVDG